jgi:O-methyltransferase
MRNIILKYAAAPFRKAGRLEQLLRATRHSGPQGDGARYQLVLPHATYSPWWSDREFQRVWEQVRDATLVDVYRLYELWELVGQVRDLDGDILEVGVWRGGSGCTMASRAQLEGIKAGVYLCDTFAGVTHAGAQDPHYRGGELSDTSADMVRSLVDQLKLDVRILVGVFPDNTGDAVPSAELRLVHIDVDVYESGKRVFEWAWPKVVSGGVVVFDDYGFFSQHGITRYADELKLRNDLTFIHNLNGHAIVVKR